MPEDEPEKGSAHLPTWTVEKENYRSTNQR
jgi:hypothetical protein